MSDDDRFLSRWSQRKRQAAKEARRASAPPTEAAPEAAPLSEEEPVDLSFLPDLEALTPESDISLFLRKGVPESLRNAALRKMWALDPSVRDYVGDALDYAWDWNAPGGVPGGGELGAGFDTAKMVARIFGDPPDDKNVIEDVAAQQDTRPAVAGPAATAASALPDSRDVEEKAAEPCISAQVEAVDAAKPLAGAPRKPRRHGGAAPTRSPKSIVS